MALGEDSAAEEGDWVEGQVSLRYAIYRDTDSTNLQYGDVQATCLVCVAASRYGLSHGANYVVLSYFTPGTHKNSYLQLDAVNGPGGAAGTLLNRDSLQPHLSSDGPRRAIVRSLATRQVQIEPLL